MKTAGPSAGRAEATASGIPHSQASAAGPGAEMAGAGDQRSTLACRPRSSANAGAGDGPHPG